ncbi:putative nicotinate-nucleotide adenylyltransferase [Clostridia bacterium]|nr:putative nicotinate-nucleotide adenylyltransferase [Clostridia bacterium]
MKKIGIYGGSFDPPHNGHQAIIKNAMEDLGLQKMLVLPSYKPPHKDGGVACFEDRFAMAERAFCGIGRPGAVEVLATEKEQGFSYTIDTLRHLRKTFPKESMFHLIIGSDMLFYFSKWYKYEAILKECKVVGFPREANAYTDMIEEAEHLGRVKVLNMEVTEISSSEIREKLSRGADVSGLIPVLVLEYINEKKLYSHHIAR